MPRHGQRIGFVQIDFWVGYAGKHHGAMRPPAALAEWRIFRGGDVGARLGGRVDHRRDNAFGAEVERAADHREVSHRHAYDRGCPGQTHSRDGVACSLRVPQPVLLIDGDSGKTLAPKELGDDRAG
jgi:hypothetical protein